jgi:hypothetical protein
MTKKELLLETGEYTQEQVDRMKSYELLNAILAWEGIFGYTRNIINWVNAAYESPK